MYELHFNQDWKDSGGATPFSWRFGHYLRWHPTLDFLYEIRKDGQVGWGSCLRLVKAER
jgi:hypothetical protein